MTIRAARAKVAIITRTKNRNIMLARAAMSVQSQTFRDFVWIIVNDGGAPDPVCQLIDGVKGLPNVIIHHHEHSKGMEAASNAGISLASSEYIVIHDDDDTWEPTFLEKTVQFMDAAPENVGGVITNITHVEEIMTDVSVNIVKKKSWTPMHSSYPVGAVQIADLCVVNQFAPIAFLFKREIYNFIDGFNKDLPVLGDWEFNLRFMMHADIAVIPERLANYHHRPKSQGAYGNSVLAGHMSHVAYDALVRNQILRRAVSDKQNGSSAEYRALAPYVIAGRAHLMQKDQFSALVHAGNCLMVAAKPFWRGLKAVRRCIATCTPSKPNAR